MPRISVILPVYDSIGTIERAIESVCVQTFTDWELILIDDASTDGTVERLRERYGSDARIRIVRLQVNGGPSVARNTGMGKAAGEWIALLDSDDAWSKDRLAVLLGASEDCDFIADNMMMYDASAKAETQPLFEDFDSSVLTLNDLLRGWVGDRRVDGGYLKPMMRARFLRDAQLSYDSTLRHGEDFVLYCEALCERARFRLVNHHGYIFTMKGSKVDSESVSHIRTAPDPVAISDALRLISRRYSEQLEVSEVEAMDGFADGLAKCKWTWAYKAARKDRKHLISLWLVVRHPSVRSEVMRSLLSREKSERTSRGFATVNK